MGRPRIEINQEQFEKLCSIQCTLSEIASFFNCSEDTIERWCKRTYKSKDGNVMGFADAYKKHSSPGKISLRRWQFRSAENGNTAMLIWLGKQYLGQREVQDIAITNTEAQDKFAEVLDMWKDDLGKEV